MVKYKRFITPAVLVLSILTTVSAKTWYLEQGQDWKLLSAESRDAFVKANTLFSKGKLTKAVRAYDKFLLKCDPNSGLYAAALQRQFSIAKKFLAGRKRRVLGLFKIKGSATGVRIMERISERAGHLAIGIDAALEVARHYEQRGSFDKTYFELAYLKWLEIIETYDKNLQVSASWPTGVIGKDALLGMARCKHAAYNGQRYDGSVLVSRALAETEPHSSAKSCYEEFRSLYPEDAQKFDIDARLNQIGEQLACKDFSTAQYYQKVGNKLSANLYCQMVITDWPGTPAAAMAKKMLARNLGGEQTDK